ncbi:MAG: DUF1501 domain-containing protein, partial [Planctomycetota bacterium]
MPNTNRVSTVAKNRRRFLRDTGYSLAGSLGGLCITALSPLGSSAADVGSPSNSSNALTLGSGGDLNAAPVGRAKRVIFLFMHGGPSHVDTFDYKPRLASDDGKPLPFDLPPNMGALPKLMKGPWKFSRRGQSGLWVSDLLPHMAQQADSLCVIRSMHTRGQSHGQAVGMVNTGSDNLVRPSVGAWVSYALGSGHPDLPAHIAIGPATAHGGPRNYGAAFLPAKHQATAIGSNGKPGTGTIPHLRRAIGKHATGNSEQNEAIIDRRFDLLQAMNHEHWQRSGPDPVIQGSIEAVDLARRMRSAAPAVFDLSAETQATRRAYG